MKGERKIENFGECPLTAGLGGKRGAREIYMVPVPVLVSNLVWAGLGALVGNFTPTYHEIQLFFRLLPDLRLIIVTSVQFRFVPGQPFNKLIKGFLFKIY